MISAYALDTTTNFSLKFHITLQGETDVPVPSAEPGKQILNHQSTCPNDAKDRFSMREFARIVRNGYRKPAAATTVCNTASSTPKNGQDLFKSDPNRYVLISLQLYHRPEKESHEQV